MLLVEQHKEAGDLGHHQRVSHSSSSVERNEFALENRDAVVEQSEIGPYIHERSERSVWNDISVFRDFFLAAFSDGYQNASAWDGAGIVLICDFSVLIMLCSLCCCCCCRQGCCCGDGVPAYRSGVRSMQDDSSLRSTTSAHSYDNSSLPNSQSPGTRRRRTKPLAVAVGFKYAEDPNGRPIIVTPTGSRAAPVDLTDMRLPPPRSPPSIRRSRSGGPTLSFCTPASQ